MSIVGIAPCTTYDREAVRRAVASALAPLGGMGRFVHPGMRVLLKPNLLLAARPGQAVTTHPAVVEAVVEQVFAAGGEVWIGDSPAGSLENGRRVWRASGVAAVAGRTGARLVPFEEVCWKELGQLDYFLAAVAFEVDLIINLPKLKTHALTLYTGAVKNLFGLIPGTRKRALHLRAPGVQDFSSILVDVLELVRPGLTIMDGILGQEGNGPGVGGTPRRYGCLAASADPVALDAAMIQAMGYRRGEVLHVAEAAARGLGMGDSQNIRIQGDREALDFGSPCLPVGRWYLRLPSWMGAPLYRATRPWPEWTDPSCSGCGTCVEACPRQAIAPGRPPRFDPERCIGCLCCVEACPEGALEARRSLLGRLVGVGG